MHTIRKLSNAAFAIDDIRLFLPMDPSAIEQWNYEGNETADSKKRTFTSKRSHGLGVYYCAPNRKGTAIVIDGNPQTNESGQNVQPSLRQRNLVEAFVRNVMLDQLPHLHSSISEKAIAERKLKITRIAIAMDVILENPEDGSQVISAINHVFRYVAPLAKGNLWHEGAEDQSTYYRPRSKRWCLKAYLKGADVAGKWKAKHRALPAADKLQRLATKILRFELVLRWAELKELRLQDWSKWDRKTARDVMLKYLRKVRLDGDFAPVAVVPRSMTTQQRLAHAAHLGGANLRQILPSGTYRKYVPFFDDFGVNIRTRAPKRPPRMELLKLACERARRGVPKWAKDAGLFGYWGDPGYLQKLRVRSKHVARQFERRKRAAQRADL